MREKAARFQIDKIHQREKNWRPEEMVSSGGEGTKRKGSGPERKPIS